MGSLFRNLLITQSHDDVPSVRDADQLASKGWITIALSDSIMYPPNLLHHLPFARERLVGRVQLQRSEELFS